MKEPTPQRLAGINDLGGQLQEIHREVICDIERAEAVPAMSTTVDGFERERDAQAAVEQLNVVADALSAAIAVCLKPSQQADFSEQSVQ